MAKISINTIAGLANVSEATVSRAMNNKSDVSYKTRQRICSLAKKVGYEPNIFARGLRNQSTGTIGLVVNTIVDPYFAELVEDLESQFTENGFHVMLCTTQNKSQQEPDYIKLLRGRGVDGVILIHIASGMNNSQLAYMAELQRESFPFVVLGHMEGMGIDYVTYDDEIGAYRLFSHLFEKGHRKIAFVYFDSRSADMGISGYQKVFSEHGLVVCDDYLARVATMNAPSCKEAVRKLLSLRTPPTAIVALNNFVAINVLQELTANGIDIPRDIALAQFGDTKFVSLLGHSITSVSFPTCDMAKVCTQMILDKISGIKKGNPSHAILMPELIIRESTSRNISPADEQANLV
ncbi:MAG: LacI family DNA-binding transcriptional regulator [Phycisphaerae bacterium]|jgi:DNA-binding LacI/PurR family transcriptional regulator